MKKENFKIVSWIIVFCLIISTVFSSVDQVSANEATTFDITVLDSTGGKVFVSGAGITTSPEAITTTSGTGIKVTTTTGTSITLEATPDLGYTFDGWSKNGVKVVTDGNRIVVSESCTILANFKQNESGIIRFAVTATAGAGGTVLNSGVEFLYDENSDATITATANTGYKFVGWFENDIKIDAAGATYKFKVTKNHTLVAKFEPEAITPPPVIEKVSVTAIATIGGTVLNPNAKVEYDKNSDATVTAIPNTNYVFAGWFENNVKVEGAKAIYKFKVENNRVLEARFVYNDPNSSTKPDTIISGTTDNLISDLNNGTKKPSEIVEALKEISKEDLVAAMQSDSKVLANISALESKYQEKTGITVGIESEKNLGIDNTKISIVGAAFNANQENTKLNLAFKKPTEEVKVDTNKYKNVVQINIELEGTKPNATNTLDVPVRITMPIPEGVQAEGLCILHYHADGTFEIIRPLMNGDATISFTLTSFSVFAFANEEVFTIKATAGTGGTVLDSGIEVEYNKNSDATVKATANTNYTFSGWYENNVKVEGANSTYTFKVEKDRILEARFTYSGSSSGSGSGSGTGSGSSSGSSTTLAASTPDTIIIEQIKNKQQLTISLTNNQTAVKLSGKTLKAVLESEKPVIIAKGNVSMTLTTELIKSLGLVDSDSIEINMASAKSEISDEILKADNKNKELADSSFNISIKVNGKEVTSFATPITLTFDVSSFKLTDTQIKKLVGIRFLDKGKINQLGGSLKTNKFEFKTMSLSKYGVLLSEKVVKITTTIDSKNFTVNGVQQSTDVAPTIINENTMVPIRFIAESLGAEVSWVDETKTATIELDGQKLNLKIGQKLEGMSTAPVIVGERTLVPLRYISEKLGSNVIWNDSTRSIDIIR